MKWRYAHLHVCMALMFNFEFTHQTTSLFELCSGWFTFIKLQMATTMKYSLIIHTDVTKYLSTFKAKWYFLCILPIIFTGLKYLKYLVVILLVNYVVLNYFVPNCFNFIVLYLFAIFQNKAFYEDLKLLAHAHFRKGADFLPTSEPILYM